MSFQCSVTENGNKCADDVVIVALAQKLERRIEIWCVEPNTSPIVIKVISFFCKLNVKNFIFEQDWFIGNPKFKTLYFFRSNVEGLTKYNPLLKMD